MSWERVVSCVLSVCIRKCTLKKLQKKICDVIWSNLEFLNSFSCDTTEGACTHCIISLRSLKTVSSMTSSKKQNTWELLKIKRNTLTSMSAFCYPIYFMVQISQSSFKMSTLRATPWSQGQKPRWSAIYLWRLLAPKLKPTIQLYNWNVEEAKFGSKGILCLWGLQSSETWLSL